MRRLDDDVLEPEVAETLAAIDATLAGEAVDPEFAEVAELALLLAADRSEPRVEFTRELNDRVSARFEQPRRKSGPRRAGRHGRPGARGWLFTPAAAAGAGGLLATVAVVVALSSGGPHTSPGAGQKKPSTVNELSSPMSAGNPGASAATPQQRAPSPKSTAPSAPGAGSASSGAAGSAQSGPSVESAPAAPAPQPPSNGRKIIQSATLDLGAPPDRIEAVAQEVFNAIAAAGGIVDRSTVTATGGPDGNARFDLRVPSSKLQQTMSALSRLKYAHVVSRSDNTQDVNARFVDANRRLADATALRAALLKQLANAGTQQQIDSLKARIHDVEAEIAAAQGTLRSLNRQVDYSQISVTIAATGASSGGSGGSGFTIGKAARDAVRVLAVAAGVALIALAALVPVGLLAAFGWWISATVRRRRREHALDLA
jgi:hypothetical protein